ncbi:unnamed protein product [Owenia fusiformis]|uniref:ZP domain-containing protein n=1 Tax=Owenia fusiformis TaxID=6347 RepID=A0A8S4N493_OWEFU|nr:unnamed protein product [Owenia fusiformis]
MMWSNAVWVVFFLALQRGVFAEQTAEFVCTKTDGIRRHVRVEVVPDTNTIRAAYANGQKGFCDFTFDANINKWYRDFDLTNGQDSADFKDCGMLYDNAGGTSDSFFFRVVTQELSAGVLLDTDRVYEILCDFKNLISPNKVNSPQPSTIAGNVGEGQEQEITVSNVDLFIVSADGTRDITGTSVNFPASIRVLVVLSKTTVHMGVRVRKCVALPTVDSPSSFEITDFRGCGHGERFIGDKLGFTGTDGSGGDQTKYQAISETFPLFKFPNVDTVFITCDVEYCNSGNRQDVCDGVQCRPVTGTTATGGVNSQGGTQGGGGIGGGIGGGGIGGGGITGGNTNTNPSPFGRRRRVATNGTNDVPKSVSGFIFINTESPANEPARVRGAPPSGKTISAVSCLQSPAFLVTIAVLGLVILVAVIASVYVCMRYRQDSKASNIQYVERDMAATPQPQYIYDNGSYSSATSSRLQRM